MVEHTLKRIGRLMLDPARAYQAIRWRTWCRLQDYLLQRKHLKVGRTLNRISPSELERLRIEKLSSALQIPAEEVASCVEEFRDDDDFLRVFSDQLSEEGMLTPECTVSVAANCTLYCVVRIVKPRVVVETGVHFGGTSAFLLRAMERNQIGELYSIDLPSPTLPPLGDPRGQGCLVPLHLRKRWTLINGDSRVELPRLLEQLQEISMFLHDSDHTYRMMTWEYENAWPHLVQGGVLTTHDAILTRAFDRFCRRHRTEITSQATVGSVGVTMKQRVT